MIRAGLALALLLAGTACAGAKEVLPVPSQGCEAEKARAMIGKSRSAAVEARALKLSGAARARWIPVGGMVTMDFAPDRLNLYLDRKGRIARLRCG